MRRFVAGVFLGLAAGCAGAFFLFLRPISDSDLRSYAWKHGGGFCQLGDGFSFGDDSVFTVENSVLVLHGKPIARVLYWVRRPFIDQGVIVLQSEASGSSDVCFYYAK